MDSGFSSPLSLHSASAACSSDSSIDSAEESSKPFSTAEISCSNLQYLIFHILIRIFANMNNCLIFK